MKKYLSLLLACILVFSFCSPAFAYVNLYEPNLTVPMIRFSGDGSELAAADGVTNIGTMKSLALGVIEGNSDDGSIKEAVINVLKPFLINGLLTGNFEPYYEAFQKEIGEIFEPLQLDNNGEASNGSGLSKSTLDYMNGRFSWDSKVTGSYRAGDYRFYYDWRLDPISTADELYKYVQKLKATTGAEKVGFVTSCLGGSVALAYVEKYGMDDLTGVSFDGSIANGSEFLGQPISGKFKIDGDALGRALLDFESNGYIDVSDFVYETIEMLDEGGFLGGENSLTKTALFKKIYPGVASAFALATIFKMPSYWACVSAEDYDQAMLTVFGPEGSEKRQTYAGLVEKIENYNVKIRKRIPAILGKINNEGNLCIISKYGEQQIPICEDANKLADSFVSVESSSFGATTSTVYDTLSDKYINRLKSAGLERYLSPDKQIDASTCLYPDQTWFIKGAEHSNWTDWELEVANQVLCHEKQLTVNDFEFGQFVVYDRSTKTVSAMTEENTDVTFWEAKPDTRNKFRRYLDFNKLFFQWLKDLFALISNK